MDVSTTTKSGLEGELLRLLFGTVCMDARESKVTAPANRGCRVFEVSQMWAEGTGVLARGENDETRSDDQDGS